MSEHTKPPADPFPQPDPSASALLADLVDLGPAFEADDTIAMRERLARDSGLSTRIGAFTSATDRIRCWLDLHRREDTESDGETLARTRRTVTILTALTGIVLGWVAAMALFRYEGTHPVNVTWVLAVFVGLQLVTLVLFLIAAAPERLRRLPLVGSLNATLVILSPGRIGFALSRILPQRLRNSLARLTGRSKAARRIYGGVSRWIVLHWSQVFALAFQTGAITGGLALVVFSDLAFGWSTTLDVGTDAMHRFAGFLAAPWHTVVPDAVPSVELVEQTRYFRLAGSGDANAAVSDAQMRTRWWPFIALAMIVYGLVPRIVTTLFTASRVRVNAARAIETHPGSTELLHRLDPTRVKTQAEKPEVKMTDVEHRSLGTAQVSSGDATVIDWSTTTLGVAEIKDVVHATLGYNAAAVHPAGGARSLAEDQSVINLAVAAADQPVAIVVKSWETPMLEFLDFLRDLRAALGDTIAVTVVPVGVVDNRAVNPEEADASVWAERLETLGDPWLKFKKASIDPS